MNLSTLFLVPYFAMIFVGLMMPSDGNHGLLTPKSLSFLSSLLFFSLYVGFKKSLTFHQLKIAFLTTGLGLFLFVFLFLGLSENPVETASSLDQFKLFFITISFVIMTLYAVSESLVKAETLIRTMIFANFTYSCLKMVLIALHILGVIDLFGLMERIDMRFMSMEMASGISRFQTSVDIVTPFFLLFVLQSRALNLHFGKGFQCVYCLISSVAIIFSFSRFLMAVGVCSVILYLLSADKKTLFKGFFAFILLSFCFAVVIGFDNVYYMIERRFFSADNYHSDLTRTQQIEALMGQFFLSPYLGMGLGGYVKDFIRDGGISHSYEVQWVAFLMQFGIIGMAFLIFTVLLICWQFLKQPLSRVHLSFLGLFIIWLLSGFTNPFLISLASGIVYAIFLLAANILNQSAERQVYESHL